ncbi:winged helix-turn-helix transcriptional regulator [Streptomyces sp. NPDC054975]
MRHDTRSADSDQVLRLRDELLAAPAHTLALADVRIGDSPRVEGEDSDHIRTLAESDAEFPPILVHGPTMRVIDGIHRLRAAAARGRTHIRARLFEGSEADCRLLAVAVNVAHGLPLSPADRRAAAARILAAHRDWSDRAVAAVAGISAKTVAEIRRQEASGAVDVPGVRIGRDGRARPVDAARGRELAGELIRRNPGASLRQIARQAGISPATVADVRNRLARGESPVRQQGRADLPEPAPVDAAELTALVASLRRDPSMRLTERGRSVLRMLDTWAVLTRDREEIAAGLPPHCRGTFAELLQGYARTCQLFADDLRERVAVS